MESNIIVAAIRKLTDPQTERKLKNVVNFGNTYRKKKKKQKHIFHIKRKQLSIKLSFQTF